MCPLACLESRGMHAVRFLSGLDGFEFLLFGRYSKPLLKSFRELNAVMAGNCCVVSVQALWRRSVVGFFGSP